MPVHSADNPLLRRGRQSHARRRGENQLLLRQHAGSVQKAARRRRRLPPDRQTRHDAGTVQKREVSREIKRILELNFYPQSLKESQNVFIQQ